MYKYEVVLGTLISNLTSNYGVWGLGARLHLDSLDKVMRRDVYNLYTSFCAKCYTSKLRARWDLDITHLIEEK